MQLLMCPVASHGAQPSPKRHCPFAKASFDGTSDSREIPLLLSCDRVELRRVVHGQFPFWSCTQCRDKLIPD